MPSPAIAVTIDHAARQIGALGRIGPCPRHHGLGFVASRRIGTGGRRRRRRFARPASAAEHPLVVHAKNVGQAEIRPPVSLLVVERGLVRGQQPAAIGHEPPHGREVALTPTGRPRWPGRAPRTHAGVAENRSACRVTRGSPCRVKAAYIPT